MTTVTIRAKLLVILIRWWTLLSQGASPFALSLPRTTNERQLTKSTRHHGTHHTSSLDLSASSSSNNVFWTPQDLTKDNPGFVPIPSSDYIKKYQNIPSSQRLNKIIEDLIKSGRIQKDDLTIVTIDSN